MIVIFSNTRIEGLQGTYATPAMATETDVVHADVIYTDNERIIAMAKKLNVAYKDFPKQPPKTKGTTPPQPSQGKIVAEEKVLEPLGDVLTPIAPEPVVDETVLTATSVPVTPDTMELTELRVYAKANGIARAAKMKRETILEKLKKAKG